MASEDFLRIDITLHSTRLFVEQMVLHAENYTPGFEPAKPNLEVHVYRIEGATRTEVPVRVAALGGAGPYGDQIRRVHQRNTRIFDETASVFLTFPPSEAQIQQFLAPVRAEVDKLDSGAKERLRESITPPGGWTKYLNSPLPPQVGSYEIVAEYQSRDDRFWGDPLSASCRFDVENVPEFLKK